MYGLGKNGLVKFKIKEDMAYLMYGKVEKSSVAQHILL